MQFPKPGSRNSLLGRNDGYEDLEHMFTATDDVQLQQPSDCAVGKSNCRSCHMVGHVATSSSYRVVKYLAPKRLTSLHLDLKGS
jgi:hypothetical protein